MFTAARLLTTALLLPSSAAYDNILISDYKKTKFHLNYTVIKDLAGKDRNGYLAVVSNSASNFRRSAAGWWGL